MKRLALLAAFVLMSAGLVAQDAKKPLDKAFAPLQGAWNIATVNGNDLSAMGGSMTLVVKDDTYQQITGGVVDEKGHVKLDATKTPMAIDLIIEEGNDAGKLQLGIVEVNGDAMKVKLAMPDGTKRPTAFGMEEGFLMVTAAKAK